MKRDSTTTGAVIELVVALLLYAALVPVASVWLYVGAAVGSSDPLTTREAIAAALLGPVAIGVCAYFTVKWWRAGRPRVWVTPLLLALMLAFPLIALFLFSEKTQRAFTRTPL